MKIGAVGTAATGYLPEDLLTARDIWSSQLPGATSTRLKSAA